MHCVAELSGISTRFTFLADVDQQEMKHRKSHEDSLIISREEFQDCSPKTLEARTFGAKKVLSKFTWGPGHACRCKFSTNTERNAGIVGPSSQRSHKHAYESWNHTTQAEHLKLVNGRAYVL